MRIIRCSLALSFLSLLPFAAQAFATESPTTTTLAVTADGDHVTSVAAGTVITLTATVKSGSTEVKVGQVNFCDASATHCTDIYLLGTAQLTKAGTAEMKFVPGIGKHSYKAVFVGTPHGTQPYESSASADAPLSVTGKFPTKTEISASGAVGDYTLAAIVTGMSNSGPGPTGKVSFADTTDTNKIVATATLGAVTSALDFFNVGNPATNPYPQSVAVADFNGDGHLDLAVPVYSIFTSLTDANILLGKGDGAFTAGPAFPITGQNVNNAAVGDFNGDGKADTALSLPDANEIQVLLGNGKGGFIAMPPISISLSVFVVATGDFNGDGKADLIVQGGGGITILLGNGDGTFTTGTTIPLIGLQSVVVGDFNRDGKADFAVADYFNETVIVFLGNGDGTFTQVSSSPATGYQPLDIAAVDLTRNGILDLVVSNQNGGYPEPGSLTVLLGKGDGTFTPASVSPTTGSIPYSVKFADFNGDGKPDLVTANAGSNTVTVLLGNGDGTFAAPLSPVAGTDPVYGAVGDFNGDGLPDLAVADNTISSMTILLDLQTQVATATATRIAVTGSGKHLVDAHYPGNAHYSGSVSPTTPLTGSGTPRP